MIPGHDVPEEDLRQVITKRIRNIYKGEVFSLDEGSYSDLLGRGGVDSDYKDNYKVDISTSRKGTPLSGTRIYFTVPNPKQLVDQAIRFFKSKGFYRGD